MSLANDIKTKIIDLNDAAYQTFCDAYLVKKGFLGPNSVGGMPR
jgi:hypothetical protein